LRRSGEKPTCLLFGPLREAVYNEFLFCANCTAYEDVLSSGSSTRIKRDLRRYKCTANHSNYFFPTDRLYDEVLLSELEPRRNPNSDSEEDAESGFFFEKYSSDMILR
jgi:hypothetical protein